jgi:hypothetical protein
MAVGKLARILVAVVVLISLGFRRQQSIQIQKETSSRSRSSSESSPVLKTFFGENVTVFLLPESSSDESIVQALRQEMPEEEFDQLEKTCPISCRVALLLHQNGNEDNDNDNDAVDSWELHAIDVDGNPKTIGGDEFYVTFTDQAVEITASASSQHSRSHHPTAVADITDLQNGRYRLNFTASPLNHRHVVGRRVGKGHLTVILQYTCGIGKMERPTKNHWSSGGHMVVRQWTTRVAIDSPTIHPFQPPVLSATAIDLSKFDRIVPFGDSLMQQFVRPLFGPMPPKHKSKAFKNIGMPLNTATVSKWIQALDERVPRPGDALLVGSHTWDLLTPSSPKTTNPTAASLLLDDHGAAVRMFVQHVRKWYPNVTLVWKSATAMHVHSPMLQLLVDNDTEDLVRSHGIKFLTRLRYMSASRSSAFYEYQTRLLRDELKVPVLDLYQASHLSGDRTRIGDGRHYSEGFNAMAAHWYMKTTSFAERYWREYIRSLDSQNIQTTTNGTLVVSLTPETYGYRTEDCRLLAEDRYLASLVNWAIIAFLSDRRLVVRPSSTFKNCAARMIHPRFLADDDDTHSTAVGTKMAPRLFQVSVPMTQEVVELGGYPKSYLAQELFSQGAPFLYGMVLSDLLVCPATRETHYSSDLLFATRHYGAATNFRRTLKSSEAVVVAVHGDKLQKRELHSCLDFLAEKVLRPLENLDKRMNCTVLFPSQELAALWETTLWKEYNCSATTIAGTALGSDGQASLAEYARAVAAVSHDGLVMSPSSELFAGLVHYLRFVEARSQGRLPVDRDGETECVFNGNESWAFS